MKILTAKQMARLDRLSIQKYGISPRRLMGNAARQCCEVLLKAMEGESRPRVVVVCGPGNNGGDGLAMTGYLRDKGIEVLPFLIGKIEKLSQESRYFFQKLDPPPVQLLSSRQMPRLRKALQGAPWAVDALFGTGLNRPLKGPYRVALHILNRGPAKILSVDMPSGVSGDTGKILGEAIRARITVTFEVPKWGQLQPQAWDYVGTLRVKPIGLSKKETKKMPAPAEWVDAALVKKIFTPRSRHAHKGSAGRLLVLAGSANMPGAGYLCALAALRTGAGLVSWAMPEEAFQKLDLKYPEVILRTLPSSGGKFAPTDRRLLKNLISEFDALALGPGWGQGASLASFLEQVLQGPRKPLVVDADGLNLVASHPSLLKQLRGRLLTPHPKEMSRLAGLGLKTVLVNRFQVAENFARRHRLWLVLKGYRSVIAGPKGEVFFNSTGGPNLATAGSGDVLTGILGALLAQGKSPRQAMLAGVYIHGRAGDRLAQKLGDRGTLASEIAEEVPRVIRELLKAPTDSDNL